MIAVFQSLLAPSVSRSRRTLVMLAAVTGVVLVVIHYQISLTGRAHHASVEWRRGQHISRVAMMYNYSVGLVWPHDNFDDYDDRIASQVDFVNTYAWQKRTRKLKVILRVGDFNFDNWIAGKELFLRDNCPITDCWNTHNRSRAREADALLISEIGMSTRRFYLPKPRGQIWIAQHRESPLHNRIDPKSVRGLINWTATYRHDSTIPFRIPYKLVPSGTTTAAVVSGDRGINYAANKTKLVAWFVSNCWASNNRMRYAQQLSKFIKVRRNAMSQYSVS